MSLAGVLLLWVAVISHLVVSCSCRGRVPGISAAGNVSALVFSCQKGVGINS